MHLKQSLLTLGVLCALCALCGLFTGCAMSSMEADKTLADGSKVKYTARITTMLQDFKATSLAASLDPEGKTTVKAGAIDNTTSPVAVDAIKALADVTDKLLQAYLAKTAIVPVP